MIQIKLVKEEFAKLSASLKPQHRFCNSELYDKGITNLILPFSVTNTDDQVVFVEINGEVENETGR